MKFEGENINNVGVDLQKPEQAENSKNKKEALSAVSESKSLDEFIKALVLLKDASEVGTESYKDAVYCKALVDLIIKGHWQSGLNLQYIDSKEIRSKLEELQFEHRISLTNNIDELKSLILEVSEINEHDTKKMSEQMDQAISLNGTPFLRDILRKITNKFGLRDRVKEILDNLPKADLKPQEVVPPEGPLVLEDESEVFGHTPVLPEERHTAETATSEAKVNNKSLFRKLFGL